MPTYFLALGYKGTRYAGFQIQQNAQTIQGEVERAASLYLRTSLGLTGSSRTDAGVHAKMNYFHFDYDGTLEDAFLYHVNAILPPDIVLNGIYQVPEGSHSMFDAIGRCYSYKLYDKKDPFKNDRAWFYPYPMCEGDLNEAAAFLLGEHDFTSFAKKRTQVYTHLCTIEACSWKRIEGGWEFAIQGNRFLRGMVRALVGTMVKVGRGKITPNEFNQIKIAMNSGRTDFSAPAHGLFLDQVLFSESTSRFLL
jgi:tRNA pseudouridine38-40 synthase